MTTSTVTPLTADTPLGRGVLSLRDGWAIVRRNLAQLRHAPGEVAGAVIFPVIMVVIFGYIFGSAIAVPGGGNYRDFLMPGMFAMTATFWGSSASWWAGGSTTASAPRSPPSGSSCCSPTRSTGSASCWA
jgi:hypothetical protein